MKRVFAFIGFSFAFTLIILRFIPSSAYMVVLPVIVILFIATLIINRTRQAIVLPVVFGSAVLACLIFMISNDYVATPVSQLSGKTANAYVKIADLPHKTNNGYTYVVEAEGIDLDNAPQNIKVKLFSKYSIDADYCDTLNADLKFYTISERNYSDNIFIGATISDYKIISSDNKSPKYYILKARDYIHTLLVNEFDDDTGGLALALLTGDRSELSSKVYNNFKICGFLHFVAVSGFHLSCVCLGLYKILKLVGVKKKINIPITLLSALIYCEIANLSKPVVRAFIMISLLLVARLFNKKADALNSLGLALLIVCINPFAVYDASTIMTFSSVIGIVAVANPILKRIKFKNKTSKYIISAFIISISVVLALMPAYFVFFGAFSVFTIITNLVFELFITVLLASVILFVLLSKVKFIAIIPKLVINLLSKFILLSTDFIADNFPFLYVDFSSVIFAIAISVIIFLLGISLLVNKQISIKLMAIIISAVLIISFGFSAYQKYEYATVRVNSDGSVLISDRHTNIQIPENSSKAKDNIILCDDISIFDNKNVTTVYIYEKVFEITDDYVIINGNRLSRNLDNTYNNAEDIVLTFGKDTEILMRRVDNG